MENSNKFLRFFIIFLLFLTTFALGFYTSLKTTPIMNSEIKISEFLAPGNHKNLDFELFWTVFDIISTQYYGNENIDPQKIQYGMIQGMVGALGDKFSEFMIPEETKQFNEALSGDFEGIGAVVDKHDLGIVVDRVIKGSPALENGVLQGDIVIEANGNKLQDLSLQDAVNFIKGPAGTTVTLKILREGENDFLIKEIIRDKIKIPSVDSEIFEKEKIGYIALNIFGDETSADFEQALLSMNTPNIEGIIIDLRDNGGGYLQSAVEILSHFIEKGNVLVTTKYADEIKNDVYYSENDGYIFDKKIVILMNGNSASASEITAGALRDYKKAILVGDKSYGKGSVQQPFDMPDGSLLKLTIAKWYTPKDYSIDQNGLHPDIKVDFLREDFENKYDRQLETAKKVLQDFIKLDNIALTVEKNTPTQSGSLTITGSLQEE